MAEPMFLEEVDDHGVARLVLNRPEVHNAFNDVLIAELTSALKRLEQDPKVRAVLLAAEGKSFSAGADLNWMKRMAGYSEEENRADARGLAGLMRTLNDLTKPTIALVQGAAYGGGVGLVACCDIAIAATRAGFCLSEVKLGLIPAVISPYVVAAIGARAARRYFVTAERFDAEAALRLGLVQEVVAPEELEAAGRRVLDALLAGGPEAQAAAKRLVRDTAGRPIDDALVEETAKRIAAVRAGAEAREGVSAFLEKRPPAWPGARQG
ncbi:MAG: enoyl-CoA hydratase/isomerase family protein [Kiloniellales bacterium]|nr:enoyl-CoA hydratase/isomerase family protein [Kiloniellales bacterium]